MTNGSERWSQPNHRRSSFFLGQLRILRKSCQIRAFCLWSSIDQLRITPQSLFSGPPDQFTWMFLYSSIQEWSGRVFWYAVWRHYASGLLLVAPFKRVWTKSVNSFGKGNCELISKFSATILSIGEVRNEKCEFSKEKCKLSPNFSATIVMSLPSLCLSQRFTYPLWSVFEQMSVAYVLIFWHLTWMGKWFEDFQVHRSFRKSSVIVGQACRRWRLCRNTACGFLVNTCITWNFPCHYHVENLKKKTFSTSAQHFVSYFLQVNVQNAAHVPRTLDSL